MNFTVVQFASAIQSCIGLSYYNPAFRGIMYIINHSDLSTANTIIYYEDNYYCNMSLFRNKLNMSNLRSLSEISVPELKLSITIPLLFSTSDFRICEDSAFRSLRKQRPVLCTQYFVLCFTSFQVSFCLSQATGYPASPDLHQHIYHDE